MVSIRSAVPDDALAISEIYGYYVAHTLISFEYEPPTEQEMEKRIRETLDGGYPYFVIEEDGRVVGYTYAGPFIGRAAARHCCELSVYLDRRKTRMGYGRLLYEVMESRLREAGICNLYVSISDPIDCDAYPAGNSIPFHHRLGYEQVATFHKCGYKFGVYCNLIWMEKVIALHSPAQMTVDKDR